MKGRLILAVLVLVSEFTSLCAGIGSGEDLTEHPARTTLSGMTMLTLAIAAILTAVIVWRIFTLRVIREPARGQAETPGAIPGQAVPWTEDG